MNWKKEFEMIIRLDPKRLRKLLPLAVNCIDDASKSHPKSAALIRQFSRRLHSGLPPSKKAAAAFEIVRHDSAANFEKAAEKLTPPSWGWENDRG